MIYNINLLHLKFFHDAVVYQSISQSAVKNFRTQSAISQGIASIERSLGTQLTTHQKQRFCLTDDGKVVFKHAQTIFRSLKNLEEDLGRHSDILAGEVSFVCTNTIALSLVPKAYLQMRKEYPEVTIDFHRGNLSFIKESLKLGTAEFGIVIGSSEFAHYDQVPLSEGKFQLFHSKALKDPNLDNGILVDHVTNEEVRLFRIAYEKRFNNELPIQLELSGWGMVHQFIQTGIGVGYLPEFVGSNELTIYPVDIQPIPYKIVAIMPKGAKLSRASEAFLSCFSLGPF